MEVSSDSITSLKLCFFYFIYFFKELQLKLLFLLNYLKKKLQQN